MLSERARPEREKVAVGNRKTIKRSTTRLSAHQRVLKWALFLKAADGLMNAAAVTTVNTAS